jgi:hypothetical protein
LSEFKSVELKSCPDCGFNKSASEFRKNKATPDELSSYCKSCCKARDRRRYFEGVYGITLAELDQMKRDQGMMCPICLRRPPEHVDHHHESGLVRGVLCFQCNAALGMFEDDLDALRRAGGYLKGEVWRPILTAPGVYQLLS